MKWSPLDNYRRKIDKECKVSQSHDAVDVNDMLLSNLIDILDITSRLADLGDNVTDLNEVSNVRDEC